eukprot:1915088-Pleurochrysis_carterae.AAC.2
MHEPGTIRHSFWKVVAARSSSPDVHRTRPEFCRRLCVLGHWASCAEGEIFWLAPRGEPDESSRLQENKIMPWGYEDGIKPVSRGTEGNGPRSFYQFKLKVICDVLSVAHAYIVGPNGHHSHMSASDYDYTDYDYDYDYDYSDDGSTVAVGARLMHLRCLADCFQRVIDVNFAIGAQTRELAQCPYNELHRRFHARRCTVILAVEIVLESPSAFDVPPTSPRPVDPRRRRRTSRKAARCAAA